MGDAASIAAVLLEHRHLRDDASAVTCACGAGLFTVEAHAEHVAQELLERDQITAVQNAVITAINTLGVTLIGSDFERITSSPIPDAEVAKILADTAIKGPECT